MIGMRLEGNWLHFKGKLLNNWVKLTDEDITRINGRREELVARLQERYGFARAEPSARLALGCVCAASGRLTTYTTPSRCGRRSVSDGEVLPVSTKVRRLCPGAFAPGNSCVQVGVMSEQIVRSSSPRPAMRWTSGGALSGGRTAQWGISGRK